METKEMTDNGVVGGNAVYLRGTKLQVGGCDVRPGKDATECLGAFARSSSDLLAGRSRNRLNTLYLDPRKYFITFRRVLLQVG